MSFLHKITVRIETCLDLRLLRVKASTPCLSTLPRRSCWIRQGRTSQQIVSELHTLRWQKRGRLLFLRRRQSFAGTPRLLKANAPRPLGHRHCRRQRHHLLRGEPLKMMRWTTRTAMMGSSRAIFVAQACGVAYPHALSAIPGGPWTGTCKPL